MTKYEIMLMLFPDMGEKAAQEVISDIKELITSFEGEIYHEDVWGIRDLAYTIKQQDQGFYIVWNFTLPAFGITELEKNLNINPGVIRYLITKTPVEYTFRTLQEYELEKQQAELEAKKAAKKEELPKPAPRKFQKTTVQPVKKTEMKESPRAKADETESTTAAKQEPEAKPEPESVEPKAEKEFEPKLVIKKKEKPEVKNLEDVDAKLKSIIDDPDISL